MLIRKHTGNRAFILAPNLCPRYVNGVNWYTNQNNFFREIRNFVLDTTDIPAQNYGTGIHWQVSYTYLAQIIPKNAVDPRDLYVCIIY